MKLQAFVLTLIIITFVTCSRDKVTVQVVRHPILKFDLSASSTWTADNVTFEPLSKVIVYPNDTTRQAAVYNRLTLNSTGRTTSGENLQLIVSLDMTNGAQLKGQYMPQYSLTNGLAEVKLYNLTDNNNLAAYSLCSGNSVTSRFQIERQNNNERLISGNFQMTLCNDRDSTQKITIINGTFTDIRY